MVHKVPENFNISDFDVFHSALVNMYQQINGLVIEEYCEIEIKILACQD